MKPFSVPMFLNIIKIQVKALIFQTLMGSCPFQHDVFSVKIESILFPSHFSIVH